MQTSNACGSKFNAGADGIPLVGELPEDDVKHLDGVLRRVGLPPGNELAEVVQVGTRGELDDDPVLPLAARSAATRQTVRHGRTSTRKVS